MSYFIAPIITGSMHVPKRIVLTRKIVLPTEQKS